MATSAWEIDQRKNCQRERIQVLNGECKFMYYVLEGFLKKKKKKHRNWRI